MDDNLLTNPTPEDFQEDNQQSNYEENLYTKDQLQMDLYTNSNKLQTIVKTSKRTLKRRNEILEISMLWKTPALPFALTSLIIDLMLLVIGGIIFFNSIPPKVPLFYNSVDKRWQQTDKSIVFIFPIFLLLVEGVIINLLTKVFRHDRRLSLVCFWIVTLLNILIFIIVSQFFSLLV